MATNDDELKFVTANHEEGVNFKSFETSKKKVISSGIHRS